MKAFFNKIFNSNDEDSCHITTAKTLENDRIYAIGDIHGRADLLQKLLEKIFRDIQKNAHKKQIKIIFLGDYIDRGSHSYEVIEILSQPSPKEIEYIFIKGNHEEIFQNFLSDPIQNSSWLRHGGSETLLSYKVSIKPPYSNKTQLMQVSDALRNKLPENHKVFLSSLKDSYENGDYFFTHAGIDPDTPLASQKKSDLRWIREKFISSTKLFEKIIVHGHTITPDVETLKNRIAVDTGAYYSGKLSCIILDGSFKSILHT